MRSIREFSGIGRVAVVAILITFFAPGCFGPPQIGPDRETFKAVDALFTAVSMKDAAQLGRCEATLKGLRTSGKLPDSAADRLDAIVAEAQGGGWGPARDRLRAFMEGQRP